MTYHGISEQEWTLLIQRNRPLPATVELCIHEEISRQAKIHPAKVAFTSAEEEVTYDALNRLSDLVAFDLVERGIVSEDVVPLCFEKSVLMIIFMLGVMKAGGAFLALDPRWPRARLEGVLGELNAKVVVTSEFYQELIPAAYPILVPPSLPLLVGQLGRAKGWTPPEVSPRNAAYVVLSGSGSGSGKAKAVEIEHRSFLSGHFWNAPAQHLNAGSRCLQNAPYWRNSSLTEIISMLCVGGTICSPCQDEDLDELVDLINDKEVNWAILSPEFLTAIEPDEVPTLETVVLAGERASPLVIATWAQEVVLLCHYGVGECSGTISIGRASEKNPVALCAGRPVGAACWIVDLDNISQLVPFGELGEILIEGPIVGRGYINSSIATDAAFITPPAWLTNQLSESRKHSRLYRTGDVGRMYRNGTLEYVSKKDSCIKIDEQRVSLEDIEHHISIIEGVRLCAVLYPDHGQYEKTLVIFLELENDGPPEINGVDIVSSNASEELQVNVDSIVKAAKARLPSHMMPKAWFAVNSFPLLPSAKIDRGHLLDWLDMQTCGTPASRKSQSEAADCSESEKRNSRLPEEAEEKECQAETSEDGLPSQVPEVQVI